MNPNEHNDTSEDFSDGHVVAFQLANGHKVKIVARYFREKPTPDTVTLPEYFAIRVYCSEHNFSKRLEWMEEFRSERDFDPIQFEKILDWLTEFSRSRTVFEYDSFDELITDFSEVLAQISSEGEDAIQHYERLPELNYPSMFDRIDDSIFNDQNDAPEK